MRFAADTECGSYKQRVNVLLKTALGPVAGYIIELARLLAARAPVRRRGVT
jgi:hypothetical protein